MEFNPISVLTRAAQAGNASAYGVIENRCAKAMENIREHGRRDNATPCGHLHCDVVEALQAVDAKADVAFQFTKAFAATLFALIVAGTTVGSGVAYGAFRLLDSRKAKVAAQTQLETKPAPSIARLPGKNAGASQ
jgi:hypothetical protein